MPQVISPFRQAFPQPKRTALTFQGKDQHPAISYDNEHLPHAQHTNAHIAPQPANPLKALAQHLLDTFKPTSKEAVEKASNEKLKRHITRFNQIDSALGTYLKSRPDSPNSTLPTSGKVPPPLKKAIQGIVTNSHELPKHVNMLSYAESSLGLHTQYHARVESLQLARVQLNNSLDLLHQEAERFKHPKTGHATGRNAVFTSESRHALEESRHHLQQISQKLQTYLSTSPQK